MDNKNNNSKEISYKEMVEKIGGQKIKISQKNSGAINLLENPEEE